MLSGYSFRPRGWALAAAVAACGAFIALGNWQAHRAEEKRTLAAELEKHRVSLSGRFLPDYTVLIDNKIRDHRAGYEVVTPLRTDGDDVLVLRGWVEAGRTRDVLPEVRTPAGQVRIDGIALERLPRVLILEKNPTGKVRQSLDIGEFAAQTGLRLRPFFLQQRSPADDGLVREWPSPDTGVAMHESYSLQWYSFAVATAVLFVVLSFRRVAPR
jgi:cytochrome oxidase assembly protein ShyY1